MNKRGKINLFDAAGNRFGETDNAVLVELLQAINKATRPLSESLPGPTASEKDQLEALLVCRDLVRDAFNNALNQLTPKALGADRETSVAPAVTKEKEQ